MITEILETISSEDTWDNRFKEATLKCEDCGGTGWYWFANEGSGCYEIVQWYRCGKCQGGEIYTMLCERCGKSESECFCIIEDFK